MSDLNLFDLNKAEDLYKIIHDVYREYIKNPSEKNFFFLALGLTHLREWIAENSFEDIEKKKKKGSPLTKGEKFFEEIYELKEFQVIRELCNKGKHFITNEKENFPETSKSRGLRAGISMAGDALDQNYFLIDGKNSQDYFIVLFDKYNEWFSKHAYKEHK